MAGFLVVALLLGFLFNGGNRPPTLAKPLACTSASLFCRSEFLRDIVASSRGGALVYLGEMRVRRASFFLRMALEALLTSLGVRLCRARSPCPNATHAIFIDKRNGAFAAGPAVVWQLEPLSNADLRRWLHCSRPGGPCIRDVAEVWEYSCDQLALYANTSVRRLVSVPLLPSTAWAARLGAPSVRARPLGVLFVGAFTREHRRAFVARVAATLGDERAITIFDGKHAILEGEALWRTLLRTKILLNVHNFAPAILEFARIMPALAAGVCVVSEHVDAASTDARLVAGVVQLVADAEAAAAAIRALLANRTALERCSAASIAFSRRQTLDRWMREIGANS